MNRVYKIVWSKTKNAYVVTSEVARSHTKSASGKAVKAALAAAVGMGVLMGGYVADAAPATNPSGDGPGIAIGTGSSSQKVDSTAVGKNAKTTGESALAVGYDSIADADGAMAVGNGNKAMAGGSLAVGARNIAQGMGGLAIGENNTAEGDDSAAVGHSNKVHAMGTYAFGLQNAVWKMYSQAYGMNNIVSEANSFAYGNSNQVGSMNSFAFGGGNLNTARWAVTVGNTNKVGGEHSFAAGFYNTIGSTSKDAVAIGQNARVGVSNFNVATTIDPTTGEITAVYNGEVDATNSVAIGHEANVMALNSVALGENTGVTKDGKNGTAIGGEASVKAENGTAAGFKATVRAKSGVALGASSFVDAEGGIALGRNSVAERKSGRAGYDFTTGAVSTVNDSTWKATDGAVSVGSSANTRQITGVAAGTEDTDAVNVAQIKGLAKKIVASTADYRLVQNASSADGSYTVDTNGDIDLTVEDKNHAGQKETVKLKDIASKSKLDDVINKGLQFDANVGGVQTNKLGSKITVKGEGTAADTDYSGENLKTFITQDPAGNTTIDVKMNKNLKAETVVATGENGKDGKIGINGKDGQTTNISVTRDGKPGVDGAPGTTTTRIVYEKPDGTKEEVATLNDGMKYGGDTGAVIKKKLNEQVNVVGGITDTNKLTTEDNLGVVSDGSNNLKVRLAKALKGLESVTTGDTVMNNSGVTINNGAAGNPVSLTKNGLNNGGNKITNVAAGDVSANSTDAVNGSQLHEVKTLAGQHTTVKAKDANVTVTERPNASGGTEYTIGLGDKVTLGTDPTKQVSIDGTTGIIKAGDKVTIDGTTGNIDAGKVKINGKDGTVNGLTNKTWDPNNITSGQAATEDQLKEVDNKITNTSTELTNKGMDFAGNEGEFHRNLGEKVTIKGEGTKAASEYSGENIRTFADTNGNVVVKMDKNLKTETIVATGENGKDGKIGINGKDGQTTNISVTSDGKPGVDGAPGTTTTRIVYEKPDGTKEEVATLNDGMKYGGDTGNVIKKKLNEQVNVVGGITDENKLTTEDNLGVVSDGSDNLKVRLAKALKGLESITAGDTFINNNGITISNGAAGNTVSLTKNGLDNGGKKITNVAAGDVSANSTDAVNGSQLHDVKTLAGKHTVVKVDGQENRTDGNLLITKTDNNGQATYNLKLNDELTVGKTGAAGKSGSIGVKGKDGSAVAINGKDGSIGLNGANGANGLTMKSGDAKPAVDGTNVTRLVLEENGKKHDVATLDDGMKYGGDTGAVIKKKLNEQVNVVGGITDESKLTTEDNLGVVSDGNNNLKVRLAKALKGLESITAGDTFINNNGITISNGAAGNTVSLTKNGLDNGGNKITNVADGVDGTDAVNVSQLKSQGSDIINKGFGIKAEDGNEVKKKLGETVDVVGDGKNISTRVEGGRVRVGLKDDILLNSVATGRTRMDTDGLTVQDGSGNTAVTVDKDGLKIKDGPSVTKSGIDAGGKKITNVAAGEADTDAVNVSQLKKAAASATTKVADGKNTTVTSETNADGSKTYHVNLNDDITLGSDPSKQISIKGTEGTIKAGQVTVNGTAGTVNGLTNKTWDPNNITSGQAATEDQLKVVSGQAGKHSSVTAGSNIFVTTGTNANGGTEYKVAVVDTPTFKTITAGNTVMNSSGLTIKNGPSITQTGVDAGGKRITNVAAGDISANSTDAVNGGQLWKTNQTINNIGGAVNELGDRMDRVGAGTAALAALHPLDFDPDDKWDVAAGYGNYKDAHAVAVGAFYRPNEDTMFSVGGSFGGGENMVNAGVSVKLGQGNHVSTSKVAMAKEIVDLRDENKDLKKRLDTMEQKMNSILGILDMGKKKDFPDVPENHWAYEYVATLAGNGILEGYPDGMFSGERSMTRYEFAAMFYRALKNGAPVDDNMDRAMNEFEPELRQIRLDRIRVDRISGKDNDRNKVERVRVNSEDDKANNDYRDVYGSHISPEA